MFARGSGHEHWEEVKKKQKMFIQKWHQLAQDSASASSSSAQDSGGGGGKKDEEKGQRTGRSRSRHK